MTIKNKGPFGLGLLLALSFLAVLIFIFSPVFSGQTGLEYADDLFNKLSKGSSYFIPKLKQSSQKAMGMTFDQTLQLDTATQAEQTAKLFAAAGGQVQIQGSALAVQGDLGRLLQNVLRDSDFMFHNQGPQVAALYNYDEMAVMKNWWAALTKMEKGFKKKLKIQESNITSDVVKKGIEPAYNFYGVESQRVADRAMIMIFLLVFYVFYTMWWGYAIFYLFEGFGLSMKKAKVKKEV